MILAAVLLDNNVMQTVAESITVEDFYSPMHRNVFRGMLELYTQGKPIEPIAIHETIKKQSNVAPSPLDITGLSHGVPHFTPIEGCLTTVREKANRRELIRACYELADQAHNAESVFTDAQNRINDICLRNESGDAREYFVPLRKIVQNEVLAKLDALQHGTSSKIKLGFPAIDNAIGGGLAPSDVMLIAANTGRGKALSLDTEIPTVDGWTTMGEIKIGDRIFDENGNNCSVINVTDVMHGRECFVVTFSDGSKITADAEHQWLTSTAASRISKSRTKMYRDERGGLKKFGVDQTHKRAFPSVVTTKQIFETVRSKPNNRLNHAIDVAKSLQLPELDLPIDPYVLGVWLGDGKTDDGRIFSLDDEVIENMRLAGFEVRKNSGYCAYGVIGLKVKLRELGVLGNKHIPIQYLRASEAQRLALLQGLMDTDGSCDTAGLPEFTTTHERLAKDFSELLQTLGIKNTARMSDARLNGRTISKRWRFRPTSSFPLFRLTRKLARQKQEGFRGTHCTRYITNVERVESVPVRCIEVDSPSHLFLASRSFIPTHNSAFALQAAYQIAVQGIPTAFLAGEMTNAENVLRLLSQVSGFTNLNWVQHLSSQNHQFLTEWAIAIQDAPINFEHRISDLKTLATHMRSLVRREKTKVLVIDYIQLFKLDKVDTRQRHERIAEASQETKRLANELDIAIIEVAQFNREGAKAIQAGLHDLEGSGQLEKDASIACIIETEDLGLRDTRGNFFQAKLRIVKGRNTGLSEIIGKFYGSTLRFEFE